MYLVYSLALSVLFLFLLPYFVYQSIRYGKYASNFKERMGRLPLAARGDGRKTIWVHAVSVGEFNAARPLLELIRRQLPGFRLVVSTTTITAQTLARAAPADALDAAFYFPFDWTFAVRRALDHAAPAAVVLLETELWPNFLRECRRRGVPTLIANGRVSARSLGRYLKVRGFMRRLLDDVSLLAMQSEGDAERVLALGAHPNRVRVCGNLKYEIQQPISVAPAEAVDGDGLDAELDRRHALFASPRLIVAGSTAPGEEKLLLSAFRAVRNHPGLEDARLVVAPRHPERFAEVARLLENSGFVFVRRSAAQPGDGRGAADVILLDSIGELASVYRFAAVVFVGGSLVPLGGHNVIEPAVFARPIVVGPHTENFRQIISDFAAADALIQIDSAEADVPAGLARELIRLLSETDAARAMGLRARDLLSRNQGAAQCVLACLIEMIKDERLETEAVATR